MVPFLNPVAFFEFELLDYAATEGEVVDVCVVVVGSLERNATVMVVVIPAASGVSLVCRVPFCFGDMSLSRSSSLSVDEVSIPSPSITFPASSCVEVMIVDDEIVEGVETVSLGLISTDPAVFATNSVLLTITDTDRTSAHCQGRSLSRSFSSISSLSGFCPVWGDLIHCDRGRLSVCVC